MLLKFKVKNYRSIKDEVVLDLQASSDKTMKDSAVFDLGKVSLLRTAAIYGANASGKSNVLKAFHIFRIMVLESLLRSNSPKDLPAEHFKLSTKTEYAPSFFELSFLLDGEVYVYGFEMDKEKICQEWLKREKGNVFFFKRMGQKIDSNKNYFKEASAVLKKETSERVLFLSVLASRNKGLSQKIVQFVKKTNYISGVDRGASLNYAFGQFIKNQDRAEKMKDFVIKADFGVVDILANERVVSLDEIKGIPDKYKSIIFKEDSKMAERSLKFFHKKYDSKSQEADNCAFDFWNEESEGTQQLFALSAPIIDTLEGGKILFIDEIDSSLHPMLCQYLISIFNSKKKNPNNAQLIFTTHDISLLSEDFLRRNQIYFTNKNKYGFTELFSLFDISERKGVDFAKRYLEGRYQALPYIVDFENLKFSK